MITVKVRSHSIDTEKKLQATLDEMYQKAKEGDEPFYNLIELMNNDQVIMTAMHNIRGNKGSKTAGIDGKTIDEYLQKPYEILVNEIKKHLKNYNPSPVRRKWIEKSEDKLRPLGIPTMIDRIIQEIVKIVIEPIAEAKFYTYSFGYRPLRSQSQAIAEILERIRRNKTYWIIEGDIKSFFDNMNHNKLITMLWKIGIKDKRVLAMIKKMLKSGVVEEDGRLYPSDVGSPQGGIISPLLSNIYLNFFDWMIAKEFQEHEAKYTVNDVPRSGLQQVRKRHQDVYLVRFADDWVLLCKTKEQAEKYLKKIDKYFKHQLSLELSKEKTLITNIREKKAKFLGFEIFAEKERKGNDIVGKAIPDTKKATKKVREIGKEIRLINYYYQNPKLMANQIEKINSKIIGMAEYYSISNCSDFFKTWNHRLWFQQYKTFSRLNGKERNYIKLTIPANQLDNRRSRHTNKDKKKERKDRVFYMEFDGMKIGITKFDFTKSQNALKVHSELTPYSKEGRERHEKNSQQKLPLLRHGTIYTMEELSNRAKNLTSRNKKYYNFEYIMNREYAYLRDHGKCRCCKQLIQPMKLECHHKDPGLPIGKLNKVSNLLSMCKRCHKLLHSKKEKEELDNLLPPDAVKQIMKLRKIIKNSKEEKSKTLVV